MEDVIIIFFIFTGRAIMAQEGAGLIAPGATVNKVQSGFTFTEGPAADAEGNVYFTDIPLEEWI
jgi:gluconolactonase